MLTTLLTSEAALHLAGRSSTGDSLVPRTLTSLLQLKGEQHSNAVALMSLKAPGPWTSLISRAKSWWVGSCRSEMSGVRLGLESPKLGKAKFQPFTTRFCRTVPKVCEGLLSEWRLGTRGSGACYFGTYGPRTAHFGAFPYSSPYSPCWALRAWVRGYKIP